MQKLVFLMLGASVAVGALMPSERSGPQRTASAPPHKESLPLSPSAGERDKTHVEIGNGAVTIQRAADGHFYAQAQVNGMPIRFLIDTGASSIALSREDAQRAAIPVAPELDEVIGTGASGTVKGQFVRLDRVTLGPMEVRGVPAAVLSGGAQSLLGQSFLAEFGSLSIEGDRMVLR